MLGFWFCFGFDFGVIVLLKFSVVFWCLLGWFNVYLFCCDCVVFLLTLMFGYLVLLATGDLCVVYWISCLGVLFDFVIWLFVLVLCLVLS